MENENQLLLMLGEMRGDVKSILNSLQVQRTDIDSLDNRVTSLENWKAWIFGAAAAVGALSSYVFQLIKGGFNGS
jgi:hypothetical protein